MLGRALVPVLLLVATPAVAQETLDALLARTGRLEAERAALTCRWNETTRLEQLDSDGAVTGSVLRTYTVVARGPETLSRTKLDEKIEGDISSLLSKERDPPKTDPKDRLNPFHPDVHDWFTFDLVSRSEAAVSVLFTPREPGERRMTGTAQLDPATGALRRMSLQPSKEPSFLDRLVVDLRFAPGPCGTHPQLITSEGSGGFLFLKISFRSRTELANVTRLDATTPSP